jgi:hypothetical protein
MFDMNFIFIHFSQSPKFYCEPLDWSYILVHHFLIHPPLYFLFILLRSSVSTRMKFIWFSILFFLKFDEIFWLPQYLDSRSFNCDYHKYHNKKPRSLESIDLLELGSWREIHDIGIVHFTSIGASLRDSSRCLAKSLKLRMSKQLNESHLSSKKHFLRHTNHPNRF